MSIEFDFVEEMQRETEENWTRLGLGFFNCESGYPNPNIQSVTWHNMGT
jgi:hypothetical protein